MPDFYRPFTVLIDASYYGIGGVLLQESHPLAFESRKLNSEEFNYTTTEKELLVIVHALRTWRCYLEGSEFTMVTDHNPLVFFHTLQHLLRIKACWSELLSAFKPGPTTMDDPLSRQPVGEALVNEVVHMVVTRRSGSSLVARIKRGYSNDPWFSEQGNLTGLT